MGLDRWRGFEIDKRQDQLGEARGKLDRGLSEVTANRALSQYEPDSDSSSDSSASDSESEDGEGEEEEEEAEDEDGSATELEDEDGVRQQRGSKRKNGKQSETGKRKKGRKSDDQDKVSVDCSWLPFQANANVSSQGDLPQQQGDYTQSGCRNTITPVPHSASVSLNAVICLRVSLSEAIMTFSGEYNRFATCITS